MKQVDGLKKELGLIDVFAIASGAMKERQDGIIADE